ncbi:uncharacterized protein LOC129616639 [Condylostylus longicornis]|uniref:uncharacterized protein LOC129616639 n=1 Tax=Condylostylus longicornis TaxID=2530218 RepID=UPI00244DB740|nr:uncharacterized protein LOC129616639 [Condylostylus longicornis]
MVKCLICPTRQSSKYYEPFSFHVIPKPEELRLKWLRAIGKQEHEISRSDVICCEHFDPTDILEAGRYGTRRLKKGTIPKRKLGKRGKESDAARPLNESSTRDEYLNLPIKKELEDELSDGTSNNCSETFSQKYVEDDGYLDLPIKAEPKDDPYPFTTDNINNFSVPLKSINEVEECPYQLTETNINICVRVPSKNTNIDRKSDEKRE